MVDNLYNFRVLWLNFLISKSSELTLEISEIFLTNHPRGEFFLNCIFWEREMFCTLKLFSSSLGSRGRITMCARRFCCFDRIWKFCFGGNIDLLSQIQLVIRKYVRNYYKLHWTSHNRHWNNDKRWHFLGLDFYGLAENFKIIS